MVPFNVVVLRSKNIEEWKRMVDPKKFTIHERRGGGGMGIEWEAVGYVDLLRYFK